MIAKNFDNGLARIRSSVAHESIPAILLSAFLGAFLVFGVGIAQSDVLHNAAHDTRHAIGFPCH